MAGNTRDGTGRDCLDMFVGGKKEDGTGWDGKIMKNVVGWTGRDATVGVKQSRRAGTVKYNDFCSS